MLTVSSRQNSGYTCQLIAQSIYSVWFWHFLSHWETFQNQLAKRTATDSLRTLKASKLPFDFCSNDYLGLARNKTIFQSVNQEFEKE